jgi:hypothetical protein
VTAWSISAEGPLDRAAVALYALALAAAVLELFYLPFLFGPIGLLLAAVGTVMSGSNRRFAAGVFFSVALGFLIGASIAVWYSRALY